ncbi:Oidioi.mRNA.OKI2018_I69.chr1.g77.t1.cds [Oikopleura dioica]|uniref:Oidioi.mRNA.OKI2018_I69.chr1.g77.t1.cds n=1 Tax=Oikopleura dioica TaxID=34765 RepID=A0ABN7SJ79_OIKDI|nr:Oidioi.mRNA.OKI2018_I69.chr1.g77.t1.cds [Oikopleura dioica]
MDETVLRELFFRKTWIFVLFPFALTMLMITKPALNMINKSHPAVLSQQMRQVPAGDLGKFEGQFLDQMAKPIQSTIMEEDVSNITVVSSSGEVFKGLIVNERIMVPYDEAKQFCEEKGAFLPWFELANSNLLSSRQIWIESECDYFEKTIEASNKISKTILDDLMTSFVQEHQTLELIGRPSIPGFSPCLVPSKKLTDFGRNIFAKTRLTNWDEQFSIRVKKFYAIYRR